MSGCANNGTKSAIQETVPLTIPASCQIPLVLAAINTSIPGAVYIPTTWQPEPGTDLHDSLSHGGIACSYGIASSEIGATVTFTPYISGFWGEKETEWIKNGQEKLSLENVSVDSIVGFSKGFLSADGRRVQILNILQGGVWISINANYVQSPNELSDLINATVDSLVKDK